MTREEIVSHNDDVRKFISDLKYKLSFIDEKKVIVCKKQLKSIRTPIQVPFDVVTYENIMMNRIKTISRTVMKEHKDMEIKKEPKEVPVSDVVGWLEIMIHNKKKFLTPSFYINYKTSSIDISLLKLFSKFIEAIFIGILSLNPAVKSKNSG